jgi:hypothetical protein
MASNGMSIQKTISPAGQRRRYAIWRLLLRLFVALAIAWLIFMAFFATSVISH